MLVFEYDIGRSCVVGLNAIIIVLSYVQEGVSRYIISLGQEL